MKRILGFLFIFSFLLLQSCVSDKDAAEGQGDVSDQAGAGLAGREDFQTAYALPPLVCTNVSFTACLKQYTRFAARELARIHNRPEFCFGIPYTILRVGEGFDWEHREERVDIPAGTVSQAMGVIAARYKMDLDTRLIPGNFIFTDQALRGDAADSGNGH